MNKSRRFIVIILIIVLILPFFLFRVKLKEAASYIFKEKLPEPKQASEFVESEGVLPLAQKQTGSSAVSSTLPVLPDKTDKIELPKSINLDIPFASQAPFGDWNMPYQEACEEAAAIMVHYYFEGEPLDSKTMDAEILKLIEWENKTFGYYKDTTAAEISRILQEYFGFKNVEVKYQFSIEDIKSEAAKGNPVILPAAGRLLPNPYFRQPGPIYHALVVKGYTQEGKIITNDPGTRNGKNFLYAPKALMNALHEWNAEDILKGRPAMIVIFR